MGNINIVNGWGWIYEFIFFTLMLNLYFHDIVFSLCYLDVLIIFEYSKVSFDDLGDRYGET